MKRSSIVFADVAAICAHAGAGSGDGNPLVAPLVPSSTFCRGAIGSDCEHQYSRVSNPTVSALEKALGALEGAPPAACFASGLAAETALFLAILKQGDHVVCGRSVYGGTTRLFSQVLSEFGVETTFVDTSSLDDVAKALRPNTKLVFVESPTNPTLELTDLRRIGAIARSAGALFAVDNTFLTGIGQRPLDHGADVSVYSTTKYIDGHSVAVGGALVTRDETLLTRLRFIRKSTGAILAPFSAWVTLQGLKTLPIRLERQFRTAARVAEWLQKQPGVASVRHPSLANGKACELIEAQHLNGDGAVIAFELDGGIEAARRFLAELELCRLVEHVGSVETLITHPATMTHADVPREDRIASGIPDGLLRLSVGLESEASITTDLGRGLAAIVKKATVDREEVQTCALIA